MTRERVMVGEVLSRATKVITEFIDEHDLGDDAAHAVGDGLVELAETYLGIARLPACLSGREVLDGLLEELEEVLAA